MFYVYKFEKYKNLKQVCDYILNNIFINDSNSSNNNNIYNTSLN